eukprot:1176842-Prorocentrum_lima.AAC.1
MKCTEKEELDKVANGLTGKKKAFKPVVGSITQIAETLLKACVKEATRLEQKDKMRATMEAEARH